MDGKKVFQKYYSRLAKEGFIKSLIIGLIIGFAVDFVVAALGWLFGFKAWLVVSLIGLVLVTAVATAILYVKVFKPTALDIARRVDKYGLHERLITMAELENDDSYIARRQREDAMKHLQEVNEKRIKLQIPVATIVLAAIFGLSGVSMSVVTGLSETGLVPDGGSIINPSERPQMCTVTYEAEEGGVLEGADSVQYILQGEQTEMVIAVADEGWMFQEWSDGYGNFARVDKDVQSDFTVFAVFVRVEEGGEKGNGDDGEEGDRPGDDPGDQSGDGDPNDTPGPSRGGKFEEANKVIDGDKYYRDIYQSYYDEAMAYLASGAEIPADIRAIVEAYFGIIL